MSGLAGQNRRKQPDAVHATSHLPGSGSFAGGGFGGGGGTPVSFGSNVISQVRTQYGTSRVLLGTAATVTAQKAAIDAVTDANQVTAWNNLLGRVTTWKAQAKTPYPTSIALPLTDIGQARLAQQIIEECILVWLANGDTAARDRAKAEIMWLCGALNDGTANPDMSAGRWPDWQEVVGGQFLTTVEVVLWVAAGYIHLYSLFSTAEKTLITSLLATRGLAHYLLTTPADAPAWNPNAPFPNNPMPNVCAVVGSVMIMCAMALADQDSYVSLCINAIDQAKGALNLYLANMPDGSSHESVAYGRYALDFIAKMLYCLNLATGGSTTALGNTSDANIPKIMQWQIDCTGISGVCFPHGDCSENIDYHDMSLFYLGTRYSEPQAHAVARVQINQNLHTGRTATGILLWWAGATNSNALNSRTPYSYYDTERCARLRPDWAVTSPLLEIKGGLNWRNHNKLDSASFSSRRHGKHLTWNDNQFGQGRSLPSDTFNCMCFNHDDQLPRNTNNISGSAVVDLVHTNLATSGGYVLVDYSLCWAGTITSGKRRVEQMTDGYTDRITDNWQAPAGQYWKLPNPLYGLDGAPTGGGTAEIHYFIGGIEFRDVILTPGVVWHVPSSDTTGAAPTVTRYAVYAEGTSSGGVDALDWIKQEVNGGARDPSTILPTPLP